MPIAEKPFQLSVYHPPRQNGTMDVVKYYVGDNSDSPVRTKTFKEMTSQQIRQDPDFIAFTNGDRGIKEVYDFESDAQHYSITRHAALPLVNANRPFVRFRYNKNGEAV